MIEPPWLDSFDERTRGWPVATCQQPAVRLAPSVLLLVQPVYLLLVLPYRILNWFAWGCDIRAL